nr:immunoglobulin light chain junction region [Macaca mulatta]MPN81870.1 immunoglobulin light chain junction region [Macaca mulatta]MPN81899.1 immunoglobulin light chain junction region [Macaca mulatta]MPN82065.1 immunoglobulin light chain junction region [Macaca mulatta]MPN82150.1 immunoglobulin light chain junction region [Macaca mulatta]
CQQENDIPPTF